MGKTSNKHKSIIIQAPASVKPDGSTSDAATESPSKHRKIIRGFQQSKSTKILAPNTVQLEKSTMKPMMNNMTTLTEASEQKKNRGLVS